MELYESFLLEKNVRIKWRFQQVAIHENRKKATQQNLSMPNALSFWSLMGLYKIISVFECETANFMS